MDFSLNYQPKSSQNCNEYKIMQLDWFFFSVERRTDATISFEVNLTFFFKCRPICYHTPLWYQIGTKIAIFDFMVYSHHAHLRFIQDMSPNYISNCFAIHVPVCTMRSSYHCYRLTIPRPGNSITGSYWLRDKRLFHILQNDLTVKARNYQNLP